MTVKWSALVSCMIFVVLDASMNDNAVSYEDAQQEVLMNQAEGIIICC